MRHVFDTMGTTVSLSTGGAAPVDRIERVFAEWDRRFSLYRPDSELSRIAAGDLRLDDAGPEVRAAYAEAIDWRRRTDGAFSPHRPDGVLDLNGLVKAAAMREAADLLDADLGFADLVDVEAAGAWTLVAGGDVVRSAAAPGRIGIVDPADRTGLLCSVLLTGGRRAVATSGSAERGDHIWLGGDPAPADFVQVSVIADDIVTADVLATAIVAAGRAGFDDLCDAWPVDVLTVDRRGALQATPGFAAALRSAA